MKGSDVGSLSSKRVIVHIGLHKTGTTSFQTYFNQRGENLRPYSIYYMPIPLSRRIVAACIREGLPIPPVLKTTREEGSTPEVSDVAEEFSRFLEQSKKGVFVVSCEHFSYFREQEEISRLQKVIPSNAEIFLVLREKKDFLESYRFQAIKGGHGLSSDPASPYYCEEDSWLLDFEKIQCLWGGIFRS